MLKKYINKDVFDPLCDYLTEEIESVDHSDLVGFQNKTQGSSPALIKEAPTHKIAPSLELDFGQNCMQKDACNSVQIILDLTY